jgi:hypothetical protein
MGLRCSLLGHAYGEPVTERDRERRGDEAVLTVRELKTCKRCGAETVLSENTEVRHLDAGDEGTASEPTGSSEETDETTAPGGDEATAAVDDSAPAGATVQDLVEHAEADSSSRPEAPEETAQATDSASAEAGPEETGQADDGGIIVDDGASDADESADTAPTDTEPSPEPDSQGTEDGTEGETRSPAAEGSTDTEDTGEVIEDQSANEEAPDVESTATPDDASGLDAVEDIESSEAGEPSDETVATAEPDSMFGTGEPSGSTGGDRTDDWKEPLDTEETTSEDWDDPAFQFESGPDRSETAEAVDRGPAGITSEGPLDVDAEGPKPALVCPECGFSESSRSSLRAGDICPECHHGYLAGRE